MNGSRSTYMRKGYLLTALAAAVLLAASSGTAWAQSVGFVGTSGTVAEDASALARTPDLLKVTVRATGVKRTDAEGDPLKDADIDEAFGKPELGIPASLTVTGADGAQLKNKDKLSFAKSDDVVLTIKPGQEDDNWKDEEIAITVSAKAGVSVPVATFTVTVDDDEVAPTAKFSRNSVNVNELNKATVDVQVVKSTSGTTPLIPPGIKDVKGLLMITADPASAVTTKTCPTVGDADYGSKALSITGASSGPDDKGVITLNAIKAIAEKAQTLTLEACGDMSGYANPVITLAFDPMSLKDATQGDLTLGAALKIAIDSDEETPEVGFVPTALTLDEGASGTVGIYADGETGTEVGMVTVSVSGDAMVSLGGAAATAQDDGSYQIDLGKSANVRFQVKSDSDPDLMDGATKTATLTITDASGADISTADGSLTVTVNGSTAVPALPLLGQLLLALFLLAGGARLYRRRQS